VPRRLRSQSNDLLVVPVKNVVQKFLSDVSKDTSRVPASRRVRTARREPMLGGVGVQHPLAPPDTSAGRSKVSRWTEVP